MSECRSPHEEVPVYVVNYNDEERRKRMHDRFAHVGITPHFSEGIDSSHPLLKDVPVSMGTKRCWAVMLDHLSNIRHFYEKTDAAFGVFCEDDVYVHRDFKDKLSLVVPFFQSLDLDVLLLSSLLPCHPKEMYPLIKETPDFSFYSCSDDTWGAHTYMLSRAQAGYLIEKYTVQWGLRHHPEKPFASDWIITKRGERALLYPTLTVEEGGVKTDHQGHIGFHKACYEHLYDSHRYV